MKLMTKILVIEDENDIRNNIVQTLQFNDYEAISSDNGKEGLDLAVKNLPNLILCDIMMPEMNGYEFLSALRANPATVDIPCILVTAKVEKRDLRLGMQLGADDYLTKPFTSEELLGAINSRLERVQGIQQKYQLSLQEYQKQLNEIKQQIKEQSKQLKTNENLVGIKDDIIDKLVASFSDPVNNINLALKMLREANTEEKKQLYLKILQDECAKEIELLNEIKELQRILTPENAAILQQFNLLKP
jgi:DNA-binding response OmpR family regulator